VLSYASEAVGQRIWLVPPHLYTPIIQQAIQLTSNTGSKEFLDFIKTPDAMKIIVESGYGETSNLLDKALYGEGGEYRAG